MWRRRRVILIGLMAALLVVATLAVVGANMVMPALAQANQEGTPPPPASKTLLARVAIILGIDEQKLKDAFAQVQRETQNEALDRLLQKAVEKGKMTQEEANQYKAWWQARPKTMAPRLPGFLKGHGFGGRHHFRGPHPPQPQGSGA